MARQPNNDESYWDSAGLERREAAMRWRDYFAGRRGLPVEVSIYEPDSFVAQLTQRSVGQLRILHILGPAQRVTHSGPYPEQGSTGHLVHFIYSLQGVLDFEIAGRETRIEAGQAVMVDNARPYVIDMQTEHDVIVAIMPQQWLERYLTGLGDHLGTPIDMRDAWAPPLASLLQTIALKPGDYPAPRPVIAEQVGVLLAFATRPRLTASTEQGGRLVHRIMQQIESDYADPDLTPELVARQFNISKRYLQSLLANSGTSFVRELNAVRLDRASEMLTDPLSRSLPIGDIAFRCGFLDPAYFTRQFRKRFDTTPRAWRDLS